jgi:hypothetical protein
VKEGIVIALVVAFAVTCLTVVHLRGNDYRDDSVGCIEKGGSWVSPKWLTPGYCKRTGDK